MISFFWISGLLLAAIWLVPVLQLALHFSEVADLSSPDWEPPTDTVLPSLTIVVPARNEEAEIEPALRSLVQLNYPQLEVIAVNDRSTDGTGEIMDRLASEPASQGRLHALHVCDLPSGWLGKLHAMWLGSQANAAQGNAAQGNAPVPGSSEWLLFTDADCVFHPDSLRRAMHYATKAQVDHLVLFPTAHMKGLGERMMIAFPQVMAIFAMRPWKVRDPSARDHIGVGAFNLIRRQAYEAIGTYEKLRMEIVDDLKLGEAIKKSGLRQDVVFGPGLVTLRWAVGAAGVVANLEKNLFAFLQFSVPLVLAVCAITFFLCVGPFLGLLLAPGWSRTGFAVATAMILLAYLFSGRYMGSSPLLFLTCPVSALVFDIAVLRSAYRTLRDGAVTWRGTRYSLAELKKKR
ncbi:MAG TPA: glycosyltransferase family 2 protein [Candidatus Angelobacter sp.]|nr:glycosyltransferase family 2 protein [Candidatus Angelobacter sp.]